MPSYTRANFQHENGWQTESILERDGLSEIGCQIKEKSNLGMKCDGHEWTAVWAIG